MAVNISRAAFTGLSSVSIANNTTTTSSEVDLFATDNATGDFFVFLTYTAPGSTVGTIDIKLIYAQTTGVEATDQNVIVASIVPVASSTKTVYVGKFPCTRYMEASINNNATTQTLTSVSLSYELHKLS